MKYKMTLGGRGAEIYIHKITDEQKKELLDMKIEDRNAPVNWDKLHEILKTEWDYTDDIHTGAYDDPTDYHIMVFNENGGEVFSSDDDFFMEGGDSPNDYEFVEKENVLVIEHYVKGTFKEYEINIDGEFNPKKITPVVVEINETISLIKDLKYDNKEIEDFEYGDDWSKGAFFYIF